jgi:hypothetical protein
VEEVTGLDVAARRDCGMLPMDDFPIVAIGSTTPAPITATWQTRASRTGPKNRPQFQWS